MNLLGVEVRFSPYLEPGTAVLVGNGPRDIVFFRHTAELLLHLSGAKWHVNKGHCPTWDDTTECRCMLGGEA